MTVSTHVLQPVQLQRLLELGGITVGPGSPFNAVPPARAIGEGAPGFQWLVQRRLLRPADGGWRVNRILQGVLAAAAQPEEVLAVRITGDRGQGFAVCRRKRLWTECTVGPLGVVKLAYPLDRSMVILALTAALSSDRPDASPAGFRFRGAAPDAFVLSRILEAHRADAGGITPPELATDIAGTVDSPGRALPFAVVSGIDALRPLVESADAVNVAVARLMAAGHVRRVDGRLLPSQAAAAVLSAPPSAGFAVTRTVVAAGIARSLSMQVMRAGERNLVFRHSGTGADAVFDWSEVTKPQLRSLVAGMLLPDGELREVTRPARSA